MLIKHRATLCDEGGFAQTDLCGRCLEDIEDAIKGVCWPPGSDRFCIQGVGKGNGVNPIRKQFQRNIQKAGWALEDKETEVKIFPTSGRRSRTGIDATRPTNGRVFAVEWETGNISSSHRSLNKLCYGIYKGVLSGGVLIVPTRALYPFLTDRIGNYEELARYFPFWTCFLEQCDEGFLQVVAVEYDELRHDVPLIPKGKDGNARKVVAEVIGDLDSFY